MARPVKRRRVCCLPDQNVFGPLNEVADEDHRVTMTIDEYETIRLIDHYGFTQEECAQQMHVARTTIQGIYSEARKKLAQLLVEGKALYIEGGQYRLCEDMNTGCSHGCRRKNRARRYQE